MATDCKIFLVDDDIFCLNLYAQHIYNVGYGSVETFSSGLACLERMHLEPCIIFLDVQMDDLNGEDVLLRIKSERPDMYIVMISAQNDLKQALHLLQLGAYDYVLKGDDDMEKIRLVLHRIQTEKELKEAQQELLKQKKIIDYQHHRIQDSIKAALRIQQIILPTPEQCKNILLDYFIIYQPKDIVSGDFYFIEERAGKTFIACVDCTGHGVSGAFMTLITHQVLHNLIFERHLDSPIDILKGLENMIRKTLKQEENRLEMGMDIALLVIEERTSEGVHICFGGAKSDLYFLTPKEETIQTICATKKSIGTNFCREKNFGQESLTLPVGTLLYMCSDGFGHQNDAHEKKFGKKRLFELIEKNRKYSLATQREIIEHAFKEHKGDQVQRDDVLLMGFRI